MSGIVATPQYKDYYGNLLGATQGGITGAIAAGSLLDALCSSVLGDWLSRKVAIQLGTVTWCIGASLQAASNGVLMLIMGRIIAGYCIGVTSTLIPIYQSEIAPRKIRGRIVSIQPFAICLGILIMYFVQYGCSFLDSQAVFRLPWALQTIPAILLFIGLFWRPRSPRWLASKDRRDEVLHVIAFLLTPDCNISDPLLPRTVWTVLLGMAAQGWSQLTGVNMLLYFIVYFLNSAGIANTLLASSFQYIVFIVATIPTMLWTDQWGRRTSLLIGSLCVAFWMFVIAGLFARFGQPNPVPDQPYTWIIVGHPAASRGVQASVYLTSALFAMSWGPIEWMYPPEIVPLRIRAKAVSFSTATNWVTSFALSVALPPLLRTICWRVFGCLNVAAFIHVWFVFPESKQRTQRK